MKEGFIYIDDNVYSTLFAISEEEQAKGLMYQEWPPPVMSFVYVAPKINKFFHTVGNFSVFAFNFTLSDVKILVFVGETTKVIIITKK